jgi:outer membrane protein assembly factor BamB
MHPADLILVAANYRVIALSKATGEQLWETVLIPGIFKIGESFVSLAMDDTGIYAHTSNQMFRLEVESGKILWKKKLSSLGGLMSASIASLGTSPAVNVPAIAKLIQSRRQSDGGGG